ncbi:hypothetical protein Tco_1131567 [Tanacetum coccineum]
MKGYVEKLERLGYGLTGDFVGFVRNYNMHNMGKKIGKLHAPLNEYEKGLPKKVVTPQVMAIQGVSKNDVLYFNAIPLDGIYEVDMLNLVLNVNSIYNVSNKRDYALESATRILNTVLTKKVDKTPYELWYGKVPNLSYIKLCYPKETMGYYFYFPPKNKIVVLRYVEFLEKNLISQEASGRTVELEEIQDEDTSPSKNTSENLVELDGFEPPQED